MIKVAAMTKMLHLFCLGMMWYGCTQAVDQRFNNAESQHHSYANDSYDEYERVCAFLCCMEQGDFAQAYQEALALAASLVDNGRVVVSEQFIAFVKPCISEIIKYQNRLHLPAVQRILQEMAAEARASLYSGSDLRR